MSKYQENLKKLGVNKSFVNGNSKKDQAKSYNLYRKIRYNAMKEMGKTTPRAVDLRTASMPIHPSTMKKVCREMRILTV